MVQRVETCEQCRFDSRDWTVQDLAGTLQVLGPWWRELLRWVDPALVGARPAPTTWSALEYVAHSRDVTFLLGHLLHAVLTVDGLELPGVDPPEARADDPPIEQVIDKSIDAAIAAAGVTPASQADDATLIRRLTLDLVGRIPTDGEVDAFTRSTDPDKRAQPTCWPTRSTTPPTI